MGTIFLTVICPTTCIRHLENVNKVNYEKVPGKSYRLANLE